MSDAPFKPWVFVDIGEIVEQEEDADGGQLLIAEIIADELSDEVGAQMAACREMYKALREASVFILYAFGDALRPHEAEMWASQDAFAVFTTIDDAISRADGSVA